MVDDFDSPWKEAIRLYFRDFVQFFFVEMDADIDWDSGWEFCDKELQAITPEGGRRHVDSLVRVSRRDGVQLVLVHIEVQSQRDPEFPERMLLYHTRIADRFGESVCSLAILGDGGPTWRPNRCLRSVWGCRLELHFPICKLLDYPDWAEGTDNPFAWLTAAHRQALATRRQPQRRAEIKFRLVRGSIRVRVDSFPVGGLLPAGRLDSGSACAFGV
ncbi:MAG: hypothetical protein J0I12_25385 [Candidatus Eremiobacteraeota bacterium]|nr:hypothetical protein [Candidatus Eremiobacteraeota bacterium]